MKDLKYRKGHAFQAKRTACILSVPERYRIQSMRARRHRQLMALWAFYGILSLYNV